MHFGPERSGALAHALLNDEGEVAPGGCGDLGPAQVIVAERNRAASVVRDLEADLPCSSGDWKRRGWATTRLGGVGPGAWIGVGSEARSGWTLIQFEFFFQVENDMGNWG